MGRKEVRRPSQLKVGGSWTSECRIGVQRIIVEGESGRSGKPRTEN